MGEFNKMSFLLLLALGSFTIVFASVSPKSSEAQFGGNNETIYLKSLYYIGMADGKSFFADHTGMNWTQAETYCSSLNLHLATINSAVQVKLLNDSYNFPNFYGFHWTSGKDALKMRQFSWEDGTEPDSNFPFLANGHPAQTCLGYRSIERESHFQGYACSTYDGYVLCDTGN